MTSPIDMTLAIQMLGFDSIDVSRSTQTYNSEGVIVVDAPTTFTMSGVNVQPLFPFPATASGGRSSGLAEGDNIYQSVAGQRLQGAIVIFSLEALFIADPDTGGRSDEVTWRGTVYSALHSDIWPSANYWRTIAMKKEI